ALVRHRLFQVLRFVGYFDRVSDRGPHMPPLRPASSQANAARRRSSALSAMVDSSSRCPCRTAKLILGYHPWKLIPACTSPVRSLISYRYPAENCIVLRTSREVKPRSTCPKLLSI